MNFDGLRVGGVELVFKKLPISKIWGYPGPNSRARGHHLLVRESVRLRLLDEAVDFPQHLGALGV